MYTCLFAVKGYATKQQSTSVEQTTEFISTCEIWKEREKNALKRVRRFSPQTMIQREFSNLRDMVAKNVRGEEISISTDEVTCVCTMSPFQSARMALCSLRVPLRVIMRLKVEQQMRMVTPSVQTTSSSSMVTQGPVATVELTFPYFCH